MAIKIRPIMFLQRQEDSIDSGLASKIRKHRKRRVHAHRSTIGHCTHENRWGFAHAQASSAPGHRLWHHEHLHPVRVYFHVSGSLGASVLTSSCDGAQIKPGSTSCPEFDEDPRQQWASGSMTNMETMLGMRMGPSGLLRPALER